MARKRYGTIFEYDENSIVVKVSKIEGQLNRDKDRLPLNYDECCILMNALDGMRRGIWEMRKWDTFTNLREKIYNHQLCQEDFRERMGI